MDRICVSAAALRSDRKSDVLHFAVLDASAFAPNKILLATLRLVWWDTALFRRGVQLLALRETCFCHNVDLIT